MPQPVSFTRMIARSPCAPVSTETVPPAGVNLSALCRRLMRICPILSRSAKIIVLSPEYVKATSFCRAMVSKLQMACWQSSPRSNDSLFRLSVSDSYLERVPSSSTSLPRRKISSRRLDKCNSSAAQTPSSIASTVLSSVVSGVRSSCATSAVSRLRKVSCDSSEAARLLTE
ncbi:hypothetical protein SDC9_127070 [bioreactor metagenome]|uniref:Uncharacterized protein n=1 Tax=bioreactor metagenome TaxID=1076179 RepID=A0A645CSE1_9ZZZZ